MVEVLAGVFSATVAAVIGWLLTRGQKRHRLLTRARSELELADLTNDSVLRDELRSAAERRLRTYLDSLAPPSDSYMYWPAFAVLCLSSLAAGWALADLVDGWELPRWFNFVLPLLGGALIGIVGAVALRWVRRALVWGARFLADSD